MFPLQNPFNPQQLVSPVSREIMDVDQYVSPSSQTVEIQAICETFDDPSGKLSTRNFKRTIPPLADGMTPESASQIRECSRCLSLIHVVSSHVCPACSFTFCKVCTAEIQLDDSRVIRLCANCAQKAQSSILEKAKKLIWGK